MTDESPQQKMFQLVSGYWHTQAIYVAAKLKVADLLADGPRTAGVLAIETNTHPKSLYRLLRALASLGIFAEDDEHRFAQTPLSETLRSDSPGSQRPMAIMRGEWQYQAWGQLLHSVQTGECAFDKVFGSPLFEYMVDNPDRGQLFDEAMTSIHGRETEAMLDVYDFSGIKTLADIGGGNGSLLTAVLERHPAINGILFDQGSVIERATDGLASLGNRIQLVAGDFIESIPGGADAYLLRHIIHDWNDDESIAILKNCRSAMNDSGRILLVEFVIPAGNAPFVGKWFDLAMMVIPGGMERTEEEYRRLLESAGFALTDIVSTATEISVIEGRPV